MVFLNNIGILKLTLFSYNALTHHNTDIVLSKPLVLRYKKIIVN